MILQGSGMTANELEINTVSAFCIPIGAVQIPDKICDQLKDYKGMMQDQDKQFKEAKEDINWTILDKNLEIKQAITDIFASWVNSILGVPHEWMITTSWITENKDGKEMAIHNHRNCLYSSVLYFDICSEDHAQLHFTNPINEQLNNGWFVQTKNDNPFTCVSYVAPIKKGLMLFFPSYLKHFHPPFKSSIPRRSLACNFFPVGKFGTGHDSTLDTNWFK